MGKRIGDAMEGGGAAAAREDLDISKIPARED